MRKIIGSAAMLATLLGAVLFQATPALANSPVNGGIFEVFMPFNANGMKCLDDPGFSKTAGQALIVHSCHASDGKGDNQLWEFFTASPDVWKIRSIVSHLCVQPRIGSTAVVQDNCNFAAAQWTLTWIDNTFALVNAQTGGCLANDTGQNGSPVVIEGCVFWDHSHNPAQTWDLG
jgi:hypothetical protein